MSIVYDPPSVLQDANYAISEETSQFIEKLGSEKPNLTFTYIDLFNIYKNTFALYTSLQDKNASILLNTEQRESTDITNDRMTYFYNQQLTSMQNNYRQVLNFYWLLLVIVVIIYFNYQTMTSYKFLVALVVWFVCYPLGISVLIQTVLGNYYNHNLNISTAL